MKWILLLVLLLVCSPPKPLVKSEAESKSIRTKVKIKGDSNNIEINYYFFRNDTIRRDSI